MILFTTRYDPESDLWQFLIDKGEGQKTWSQPMTHQKMASIAKLQYHRRCAEGKASQNAKTFYASSIPVKDLLSSGAFSVTKCKATSPELLKIERDRERARLRATPVDELMRQLGLNNAYLEGKKL
jgi:hypothetical protein